MAYINMSKNVTWWFSKSACWTLSYYFAHSGKCDALFMGM